MVPECVSYGLLRVHMVCSFPISISLVCRNIRKKHATSPQAYFLSVKAIFHIHAGEMRGKV